jgi:two-component system, OmpR family, response regulator RegX3
MRVLLCEDDTDFLDVTTYALRKHGYDVIGVHDGASAVDRWQREHPDLVLLDVNLPHKNGSEICREIRRQSSTPIIMLTAADEDENVLMGFESGADDYVVKPVSYKQLAMRMRVIIERRAEAHVVNLSMIAESGDIRVDLSAHEVTRGGVSVRLTRLEARVLYMLVQNAGRVVSTDRLIDFVWNYEGGDSFALKTHICHIRSKLDIAKSAPGFIRSVPHLGYTLVK